MSTHTTEVAADLPPITDEELTALALAAAPPGPLPPDAVPLAQHLAGDQAGLPGWYMPAATARRGPRWRAVLVLSLVGTFLVLEILGLCSAYGLVVLG